MKDYIIYYKSGNTLAIKAHDISKEDNGWTIWNGLASGLTFLSDEYIKDIKEVRNKNVFM